MRRRIFRLAGAEKFFLFQDSSCDVKVVFAISVVMPEHAHPASICTNKGQSGIGRSWKVVIKALVFRLPGFPRQPIPGIRQPRNGGRVPRLEPRRPSVFNRRLIRRNPRIVDLRGMGIFGRRLADVSPRLDLANLLPDLRHDFGVVGDHFE